MLKKKGLSANLKARYNRLMEIGLIISLIFCIILFQAFKKFDQANQIDLQPAFSKLIVENIPPTEQELLKPPPPRPSAPIPTEDENVPADETIDPNTGWLKIDEIPPPPEPEIDITSDFIAYEIPPQPIGGFAAIQRNLKYPEIARKAGVEGMVVIKALIDEQGRVIETVVFQSLGNNGCDEAAIIAIKSVKWSPALQRDIPVKIWIAIPVVFRLR